MERPFEGVERLTSVGLAALVAAAALAIVIPVAHGHLTATPTGTSLANAPAADGGDAAPLPECTLCLAAGQGSAALGVALLHPTHDDAATRAALPEAPAPQSAARRGPASPRAPPTAA